MRFQRSKDLLNGVQTRTVRGTWLDLNGFAHPRDRLDGAGAREDGAVGLNAPQRPSETEQNAEGGHHTLQPQRYSTAARFLGLSKKSAHPECVTAEKSIERLVGAIPRLQVWGQADSLLDVVSETC